MYEDVAIVLYRTRACHVISYTPFGTMYIIVTNDLHYNVCRLTQREADSRIFGPTIFILSYLSAVWTKHMHLCLSAALSSFKR